MIIAKKRNLMSVALAMIAVFIFLHLWKFPEIPNGFFYDEAAEGYSAYCIAMTGADEYGTRTPMFFKSFDNYLDPVIVYMLAPMVKVFGLEKWVIRLPGAFFLLLSSVAFFFLISKYLSNRWICLGGAFLFSMLPWVFPLSRTGIGGYMPMLLGMIGGWYFLLDAFGRRSRISAVLAGAFWAFAVYSHHIGKPMSAVILFCFALALNVLLVRRWRIFAVFAASLTACMIPMIVSILSNPLSMTSRFSQVGIWKESLGAGDMIVGIFCRYLEYFSPFFLFISGDSNLRHNTDYSGELFVFMAPFIIAGIFFAVKNFRRNAYVRFLALALVLYPTAASLTAERMHSTRCLNGAPFWCILSVIGFYWLWTSFPKYRLLVMAVCCFGLMEMRAYFDNYFGRYAEESRNSFVAPLAETVELAFKNIGKGETLYVSSSVFHHPVDRDFKPVWYIYFLFFGKIDPAAYHVGGIPESIVMPYQDRIYGPGIFIRLNSRISTDDAGNPIAVLNMEPIPEGAKLIHKIPLSAGSGRFFEIYRVY